MATNRKLCDISGVPFVIEERDGEKFIVGVKVRRSVLKIEGSGIPVDVVDKIDGVSGDQKINGVEEIEDFAEIFAVSKRRTTSRMPGGRSWEMPRMPLAVIRNDCF